MRSSGVSISDTRSVGNHGRGGESGIVQVAADRLLHDQLLIFERGLRSNQVLRIAGHAVVGVQHVERRQGADRQLLAVVRGELRRLLQRSLLGLHVFIVGDQLPVDVLDLIDGVEDLLAEGGVGDAPVVFGVDDEAAIDARPKAIEQVLRQQWPESSDCNSGL